MKRISKIGLTVLVICLFVCTVAFAEKTSGVCGDNVTWSYDAESKVLTIDGTGDMWNYPVRYVERSIGPYEDAEWVLHPVYYEYDYNVTAYVERLIGPYEYKRWVIFEVGRPCIEMFIGDEQNGKWELVYTDRPYEIIYAGDSNNGEWLVAYTDKPYELVYIGDEENGKWEVLYTDYDYIIKQIGPNGDTWVAAPAVPWYGLDIEKIVLSESVTDICMGPLVGYCYEVEEGNNAFYSDENGVLFTKDKKTLISYPTSCENKSFDIPDGVTKIEYAAFAGSENLESVVIPDSVKCIEQDAFNGCTNLSDIDFPEKLEYLDPYAFDDTAWETNHLEGIIYAANFALGYALPDDYDYYEPEPIELVVRAGTTHIVDYAFCEMNITSVELPEGLESIGDYAFNYCGGLETVVIPDSVEYLGGFAFEGCTSLKNVVLGNGIDAINMYTFADCENLLSIDIPDSVKFVETRVFSGCYNLLNIEFPAYLEYIDLYAICETAWWNNHPEGVIYVANFALGYSYSEDYDGEPIELVIKEGTTHICEDAFGWMNIVSVEFPEGLKSIGDHAFGYCEALEAIVIPDSVKYIGDSAFEFCPIQYIELPYGVETVGANAFTLYDYIVLPETVTNVDVRRLECSKLYVKKGSTAEALILEYNEDNTDRTLDFGYYYDVMLDSGIPGKRVTRAYKLDDRDMYVGGTPECSGYIVKGWAASASADETECLPDNMYTENKNTTLYAVLEKADAVYTIDDIWLLDSAYNELDSIPDGEFLVSMEFSNIASYDNDSIAVSSYDSDGRFLGIVFAKPDSETGCCDIPIDNTDGKTDFLKVFIFDKFSNMMPYAEACEMK